MMTKYLSSILSTFLTSAALAADCPEAAAIEAARAPVLTRSQACASLALLYPHVFAIAPYAVIPGRTVAISDALDEGAAGELVTLTMRDEYRRQVDDPTIKTPFVTPAEAIKLAAIRYGWRLDF